METKSKIVELFEIESKRLDDIGSELVRLNARITGFQDSIQAVNGSANESFRRTIEDKISRADPAQLLTRKRASHGSGSAIGL